MLASTPLMSHIGCAPYSPGRANTERIPPEYHPKQGANTTKKEVHVAWKTNDEDDPFIPISDLDSFNYSLESKTIQQPPTPYAAVYPFNHVHESESGHLIEVDDTPTKERLHWYHRSGTFTEFHPKGNRVDNVTGTHYHMVVGNHESIVDGQEKKIVRFDSISSYAQSKFENISNDMVVTANNGDIILGAPAGTTLISGGNVLLDAANTLVLQAGQIIRSDDAASDVIKGSYKADAQGEYSLNAGKLTLGSMGATNISSFGAMSQTIGGSSEEVISKCTTDSQSLLLFKARLLCFKARGPVIHKRNPVS